MSDVVTFALNKRQLDALRQKGLEMGLGEKSINLTAKAILLSLLDATLPSELDVNEFKTELREYVDSRLQDTIAQWDYTLDLRLQPLLDRITALEAIKETNTTKTAVAPKTRKATPTTTATKNTTTGTVPKRRGRKPKQQAT